MKRQLTIPVCIYHYFVSVVALLIFNTTIATANRLPLHVAADSIIEGRWDLTISVDGKEQPSWLEIRHSGTHRLIGHFVGSGGSARPISSVTFVTGKMNFTLPPQWEKEDKDLVFEATLQDGNLTGTMVAAD